MWLFNKKNRTNDKASEKEMADLFDIQAKLMLEMLERRTDPDLYIILGTLEAALLANENQLCEDHRQCREKILKLAASDHEVVDTALREINLQPIAVDLLSSNEESLPSQRLSWLGTLATLYEFFSEDLQKQIIEILERNRWEKISDELSDYVTNFEDWDYLLSQLERLREEISLLPPESLARQYFGEI